MTMLSALDLARELGVYARPVGEAHYAYRWGKHGVPGLRISSAVERRGRVGVREMNPRLRYVEDDLCNVTRPMLADEWMVCERDGTPWEDRGPRLSDFAL